MEAFLVLVILTPTQKAKHDDGATPIVVVQPTAVMAKDEATAAMKAYRLVPEEHSGKEDLLEVRVIPFKQAAALART